MLLAHLAPGYFAAVRSRPSWNTQWNSPRRVLLWAVALGSTAAPDLDVIYNSLFRGFINHSTLWTHSLFLCLFLGFIWWILSYNKKWLFLQTCIGLAAFGWFSHLVLDLFSHGTTLFYPFSMLFVGGVAPARVVQGGLWAYITDPIFLFEPLLLSLVIIHWAWTQNWPVRKRKLLVATTVIGLILFGIVFILSLGYLQAAASRYL